MADWYASTSGAPGNSGTLGSPWDLESALVNTTDINPGDTLWLLQGTYMHPNRGASTFGYKVGLQGSSGSEVTVRPYNGGHVTIDGGIHMDNVAPVAQYCVVRDLEIIVSENQTLPRISDSEGSTQTYEELDRPWGGAEMQTGVALRLINCVIHDNAQGVGFWSGVTGNSECYGNIIYENGWYNPSGAPHGHGIYTQNIDPNTKTIDNNIFVRNYNLQIQAYGSGSSHIENYTVERNIALGKLPGQTPGNYHNFLIGGFNADQQSNFGFEVNYNRVFRCKIILGWAGGYVQDAVLTNNHGAMFEFEALNVNDLTMTNNFEWREIYSGGGFTGVLQPAPEPPSSTPTGPDIFIEPNIYQANRAHVAVFNYFEDAEVEIDFSSFLTNGQEFYLLDPTDFYGQPVYAATYGGSPLMVPTGGKMFVTFVLIQGETDQPVVVPSSGFMW